MQNTKVQKALELRKKRIDLENASMIEKQEAYESKINAALSRREKRIESSLPSVLSDIHNSLTDAINSYNRAEKPEFGAYDATYNSQRDSRLNISGIRSKVNAYRKFMKDEDADNILSVLDKMESGYDAYLNSTDLYGELSGVVRNSSDVQKELDETNAALDNLNNEEPTTMYAALQHQSEVGADVPVWGPEITSTTAEEVQGHGSQVLTQKEELEKKAALLNDELYWIKYVNYMSNQNNAGFSKYSQYQQTGTTSVTDSGETVLSGEDEVYEYINNRNGYRQYYIRKQSDDESEEIYFPEKYETYTFMKDDEIEVYNYLYHSQGKEAADQFLDFLSTTLNARHRENVEGFTNALIDAHPWLNSIGLSGYTVITAPLRALTWIRQTYDYLDDGKIDQNAPYNYLNYTTSAIRSKVAEKIEQSGKWGVIGSFAYQTGMSMGDFLMTTAVSGGNQTMALAIMGTSAAADTTIQAKDRGLSDDQAFTLGVIAGAAEVITEKIGLDALFDVALLNKNKFTYLLKNAFGESIEEPTSGLINMMADIYISKDKSEWEQSIKAYEDKGYSEPKAFWKATLDQAKSLGMDALGGFVSGTTLGGGSIAVNAVSNAIDNRSYKAGSGDVTVDSVQNENGQAAQETAAEPQPGTLEYVQMLNDMGQDTGNAKQNADGSQQSAFDMYEDVLAQGTNAAADPVSAAVDAFMTNGTVTNKQAQDILNNSKALQILREKVGLELPSSAAGRRNAVKAAVAQLAAQQQNTQTTADAVTDTASNQNSVVPVKEHISMADFANQESPVWNNVDYTDDATKTKILQSTHDSMVAEGSVVQVSDSVSENVEQAFPDLRSVKKKERTPILKTAMNKLKNDIRQFLNGFKNKSFEFEVNGKVLEATLYNTGINEVLDKVTKQKANMLYSTGDIFQNARYLYSTQDYDGNPNVYRWNYFYTPVQIGNETVGVRIAVRDVVTPRESQVYNWGIKKDTSLDGVGRGTNDRISHGVSSDVSNNNIPKTRPDVNTDLNNSFDGQETANPSVGAAQASVDTNIQTGYNNSTTQGGNNYAEGLQQNDRAGGIGDPAQGMAGLQQGNGSATKGRTEYGGVAVNSGILRVSPELTAAQKRRGTNTYAVHETTSTPEMYEQALIDGRNSDQKNGWCVTIKTAQEFRDGNIRTFMNDTGTVGFGIAPDGDIVAVFKNKNSGPSRALDTAMPIAIEQGGDRLDCYGHVLANVYERYGFIPVARVEFNSDVSNDGWTPDKGTPYVYVMMHNGDSAAKVAENIGKYPISSQAQLDALPTYGKDQYYDAMAYRDSLIKGKKTSSQTVGAESGYAENTVGGAQSRFEHKQGISNVYSNTYANATDESVRKVGEQSKAADPGIDNYDVITEKESTYNASMRTRNDAEINFEYDDLMAKSGWTGEDNDTAVIVLDHLRKSGDSERLTSLARKQREEGTRSGQLVQSFAKYSRQSATDCVLDVIDVIDGFSEGDIAKRHYKGQQFDQWKQSVIKTAVDVANQIDAVQDGDVEGMKEIIRSLARFRKTTAWFGYSSNLAKIANSALKDIDFDTAKAIANAQLSTLPKDFQKRSVGQVVKTLRIHNMLSALTTVDRNLGGNTSIGIIDAVSDSTVGRGLDYLVSLATNKRTVGNDVVHAKTYFKGAAKAAKIAALCTELDIPMDSESRFSTGMTRTYSPKGGPVIRFLSAFEKYMRYALEVTDQFYEGGANAAVEKSLENLSEKSNLTAEETAKIAELVGKRRTFKEDRAFARAAKGVKNGLNELGTGNIGIGDLALPFAGIGSNVGQTAIDYSSLGIGGFIDIFRLMSDVKNGKYENGVKKIKKNGKVVREISLVEAQRKAVSNAARGLTGVGMIASFVALAAAGILGVHKDEDRDKRGLEQSLNLSGAQLNVDAAMRWVRGESTDWQEGDKCLSVDFLEPFNAQMYVGYLLSQDDSVQDMLKAYPRNAVYGIYQSVMDMPMMQGLSDLFDLFTNVGNTLSNGGEWEDVVADAGGQILGNVASGFIPSWLRQTAQVIDPYYRDTTGETAGERAVNQIFAMIPGLSKTLPKKYNGLGQEQRRYDDLLPGILNTMVNPGDMKQIKSNDVADYLDELSERTGNVTFYPSYIAPGSFQLDGNRFTINGKEDTEKYQKTYGTNVNRLYGELIKNKDFLSASDEMQVKILNSAKDYAVMLAKASVSDYSDVPSYIKKRAFGMSEAEAILRHALLVKPNGDPVSGNTEKYSYLSVSDASYVTDLLNGLHAEEGKDDVREIQKIEAIVSADNVLSDEEQKKVLKDNVKESVYNKYLAVLKLRMDNDDFAATYRTYLDEKEKGGKGTKARIISSYKNDFNVTDEVAEKIYDIYAGNK